MEKGHYGHYSGNARHSKHMTNSWEEEDVKRGKKQMAEGNTGHAEALFDDAHGSYNYGAAKPGVISKIGTYLADSFKRSALKSTGMTHEQSVKELAEAKARKQRSKGQK
jgi:hypothetical protein